MKPSQAGFLAAVAAGLVLPHEGGRRFYHAHVEKKASSRKKAKRKHAQASRRRNRK